MYMYIYIPLVRRHDGRVEGERVPDADENAVREEELPRLLDQRGEAPAQRAEGGPRDDAAARAEANNRPGGEDAAEPVLDSHGQAADERGHLAVVAERG